jgi:FtsP/CotA-like multicopper oxidase with cupredoxin domain/peroxiredoxin
MLLRATVVVSVMCTPLVLGEVLQLIGAEIYDQRSRDQTLKRDVSFVEPQTYTAGQDGTRMVLHVKEAVNAFNSVRLRHRSYNGGLVGPVIHVRPGTSLDIRLENQLPAEYSSGSHGVNDPHGFNTTNLHTHGLHVSPKRPADDVFLEIPPGGDFDFHFDIPTDHPAGTFWYHAHKHGSTALQLASGMAGALIVDGGLDDAPGIREAKERILVLQQFVYHQNAGEPASVSPEDIYENEPLPIVAVNGQVTPTLLMRPGEVQRWRMIHAGIEDPISLRLDGISLHEIAVDGLALGTRVERDAIELYPGYRSDVLIKAPSELGTYVLTTEVSNLKRTFRKRLVAATGVLKLVIGGPPLEMALPAPEDLRIYAAFTDADVPGDDEIEPAEREIRLKDDRAFQINDEKFDPAHVKQRIRLGSAEKWTVKAVSGGHPFHIHVNPFAIRLPSNDASPNRWLWRDTYFVGEEDRFEMRSRFRKHSGKTVLHCHILDHEDQGMMQVIEIEDAAAGKAEHAAAVEAAEKRVPDWRVQTADGRKVNHSDFTGRRLLMVFHRGVDCLHCSEQLAALAKRRDEFAASAVEVVAICPTLPESSGIERKPDETGFWYPLCVDPELKVFEQFGCLAADRSPRHALVLIDALGQIRWQSVTESADPDIDSVLALCKRLLGGI